MEVIKMNNVDRVTSFLNEILSSNPAICLRGIDLVLGDRNTKDGFRVCIGVDEDVGRVEVTVDPDVYDELSEIGDESIIFSAADGFDLTLQAHHCTTWSLASDLGNDSRFKVNHVLKENPISVLEDVENASGTWR